MKLFTRIILYSILAQIVTFFLSDLIYNIMESLESFWPWTLYLLLIVVLTMWCIRVGSRNTKLVLGILLFSILGNTFIQLFFVDHNHLLDLPLALRGFALFNITITGCLILFYKNGFRDFKIGLSLILNFIFGMLNVFCDYNFLGLLGILE